jgi:hypothetical protein
MSSATSAENLSRGLRIAGTGIAGFLLLLWILTAYKGFMANKVRQLKLEPMLSQARKLNADFAAVAADPGGFSDKYALWCVQNLDIGRVYYRADMNKGLRVLNYERMPKVSGYKHKNCADMLLRIKGGRKLSMGGAMLDVQFVAILEPYLIK